jgi:hypothetical protein
MNKKPDVFIHWVFVFSYTLAPLRSSSIPGYFRSIIASNIYFNLQLIRNSLDLSPTTPQLLSLNP